MADNKRGPDDDANNRNLPKLPPRSGDWHSGLKKPGDRSLPRKTTADDTVSDFLANSHKGPESPDWDPVESPREWSADDVAAEHAEERGDYVPANDSAQTEPRRDSKRRQPQDANETRRIPYSFYTSHTRLTDLMIALVLAVLAFASVATTYRGFGHSWDEALYLKPAERAAAWMLGVINSGDDSMLRQQAVDRHWGTQLTGHDPLHPEVAPVAKLLPGAGLTYLQDLPGVDPMTAMRLPNAILFGLTVALLFLLGTREYGRIGGFAAALFYLLMPRVFGHAHIAASETPLAFFTVLTAWCFLVANRFWPVALFTGIALGAAVATKVTALALPVPLMLWGQLYRRRDYGSNVFAMVFIAPLVALALWPWLWYDTFARAVNYIGFYLNHQHTALFYQGRKWGYGSPNAPLTYAPHLTALVLPVWLLVFLALGVLRTLFSTIRRPVSVLFLVMVLFWIGLTMLPDAPRYDGERLWFPAFAFIALLAGGGFSLLFAGVRRWRERRDMGSSYRETGYLAALALLIVGVYGTVDLYVTHPNNLNYFNWIVGRAQGAFDQGYETSYWGEAVNEDVTEYLNEILEPGDKVKTLALNELAFENLRQWGKLPENVDFSPDEPPYDYAIMQVRQGFMGPVERRLWLSKEPLKVFVAGSVPYEAGGVPRIMIYDAAAIENVFPPPPGAVQDEETTSTETTTPAPDVQTELPDAAETLTQTETGTTTSAEEATTAALFSDNVTTSGASIAPVEEGVTTTAQVRARDFRTTGAQNEERARPDKTTSTVVLDLQTTDGTAPLTPAASAAPDSPEVVTAPLVGPEATAEPEQPAAAPQEPAVAPEPPAADEAGSTTPAQSLREAETPRPAADARTTVVIENAVPTGTRAAQRPVRESPLPAPAPADEPAPAQAVPANEPLPTPAPAVAREFLESEDADTTGSQDIAPSQTLELPSPTGLETSAPATYEDDLPATAPLEITPDEV